MSGCCRGGEDWLEFSGARLLLTSQALVLLGQLLVLCLGNPCCSGAVVCEWGWEGMRLAPCEHLSNIFVVRKRLLVKPAGGTRSGEAVGTRLSSREFKMVFIACLRTWCEKM